MGGTRSNVCLSSGFGRRGECLRMLFSERRFDIMVAQLILSLSANAPDHQLGTSATGVL